ncbi:HNH endonuclease [Actinoplanes sp. NPDC049118]|uniref:HNH endonuclease n=1 Tax=Actinoplanes sp. NPDC049118 TaxID=3155769 RepID=UPI0033E8601F
MTSSKTARRRRVINRWSSDCWLCGLPIDLALASPAPGSFSIDHVTPQAYGGSDRLPNLRPAHRSCNAARGHRYVSQRPRLRLLGGAR